MDGIIYGLKPLPFNSSYAGLWRPSTLLRAGFEGLPFQSAAEQPQILRLRPVPQDDSALHVRFVLSHPWRKNKDAPRMGHPFSCRLMRREKRGLFSAEDDCAVAVLKTKGCWGCFPCFRSEALTPATKTRRRGPRDMGHPALCGMKKAKQPQILRLRSAMTAHCV